MEGMGKKQGIKVQPEIAALSAQFATLSTVLNLQQHQPESYSMAPSEAS